MSFKYYLFLIYTERSLLYRSFFLFKFYLIKCLTKFFSFFYFLCGKLNLILFLSHFLINVIITCAYISFCFKIWYNFIFKFNLK